MINLYEFSASGNCHKIRMMLSMLGVNYTSIVVDGNNQAHKSPEFLALNPFGQVPVLTDGTIVLRDSQAILFYLAQTYGQGTWLPNDPVSVSKVVAWLSTAVLEVSQGPAMLRQHYKFGRQIDKAAVETITENLFQILETHLSENSWMVGTLPTIADIALYPYIALAREGHWDFSPYPGVRAWLGRIRALPGYVGMPGLYEED